MKIWIHQIKESMQWQRNNYQLLEERYEITKDPSDLVAYIKSFGEFKKLEGRYEQWHTDAKEFEEEGTI